MMMDLAMRPFSKVERMFNGFTTIVGYILDVLAVPLLILPIFYFVFEVICINPDAPEWLMYASAITAVLFGWVLSIIFLLIILVMFISVFIGVFITLPREAKWKREQEEIQNSESFKRWERENGPVYFD